MQSLSASAYLELARSGSLPLLDVRSEGEFFEGHLPDAWNGPILNNEERRLVGTCYKQEGQDAAIALGHRLVDPQRQSRVESWRDFFRGKEALLLCWRGGLRSQTAQKWLAESGVKAKRIEGGYKAVRRLLLASLGNGPKGFVVSGPTGSAKTLFLRRLRNDAGVDLEEMANHRGSAFGRIGPQPSQATFENRLALALQKQRGLSVFEDESRCIGRVVVPDGFYERMKALPVVVLDIPLAERVRHIYEAYVKDGDPENLTVSLDRIRKKLGGLHHQEIRDLLQDALIARDSCQARELHERWILRLLEVYYDPLYTFSFQRLSRPLAFRGDPDSCRAFLEEKLAPC